MNNQEKIDVRKIAKHVFVLNREVGEMKKIQIRQQIDIKWIKKILFYLSSIITFGLGKIVFFGG